MRHIVIAIRCAGLHFSITGYRFLWGSETGPSLGLVAFELQGVLGKWTRLVRLIHDVGLRFMGTAMTAGVIEGMSRTSL